MLKKPEANDIIHKICGLQALPLEVALDMDTDEQSMLNCFNTVEDVLRLLKYQAIKTDFISSQDWLDFEDRLNKFSVSDPNTLDF